MAIEDQLKDMIKKLNIILEENTDVSDEIWYLELARGTTYLEKSLNNLNSKSVEMIE